MEINSETFFNIGDKVFHAQFGAGEIVAGFLRDSGYWFKIRLEATQKAVMVHSQNIQRL